MTCWSQPIVHAPHHCGGIAADVQDVGLENFVAAAAAEVDHIAEDSEAAAEDSVGSEPVVVRVADTMRSDFETEEQEEPLPDIAKVQAKWI